ncbi:MAG: DUF488 domain-containing protein [Vulcanimicrobiaceae bacterium]
MPLIVEPRTKAPSRTNVRQAQAVLTIGYQGRSAIEFIRALRAGKVTTLVDIRAVPMSRRAEFRKNALATLLDDAGIRYVGVPRLGTPRDLRDKLKDDGDYASFFKAFRAHMLAQRSALRDIVALSKQDRIALLCFERDASECHRSVVAAYVSGKLSCEVVDL